MAKKASRFRSDLIHALWTISFAAALGIIVNALSPHPLIILADPPVLPQTDNFAPMGIEEYSAAFQRGEPFILLDVRGDVEYNAEHSPRALHVPLESLMTRLEKIAPNLQGATTIVTMCDSAECNKAEQAAELLRKLGYKSVRVLKGGWESYRRRAELPREIGNL